MTSSGSTRAADLDHAGEVEDHVRVVEALRDSGGDHPTVTRSSCATALPRPSRPPDDRSSTT